MKMNLKKNYHSKMIGCIVLLNIVFLIITVMYQSHLNKNSTQPTFGYFGTTGKINFMSIAGIISIAIGSILFLIEFIKFLTQMMKEKQIKSAWFITICAIIALWSIFIFMESPKGKGFIKISSVDFEQYIEPYTLFTLVYEMMMSIVLVINSKMMYLLKMDYQEGQVAIKKYGLKLLFSFFVFGFSYFWFKFGW